MSFAPDQVGQIVKFLSSHHLAYKSLSDLVSSPALAYADAKQRLSVARHAQTFYAL